MASAASSPTASPLCNTMTRSAMERISSGSDGDENCRATASGERPQRPVHNRTQRRTCDARGRLVQDERERDRCDQPVPVTQPRPTRQHSALPVSVADSSDAPRSTTAPPGRARANWMPNVDGAASMKLSAVRDRRPSLEMSPGTVTASSTRSSNETPTKATLSSSARYREVISTATALGSVSVYEPGRHPDPMATVAADLERGMGEATPEVIERTGGR